MTEELVQTQPLRFLKPQKGFIQIIKKTSVTLVKWLGRLWKGLSYSIGSLILFLLLFGLIGAISLPKGSQLTSPAVSEQVISGQGPDKIAVIRLSGMISTEAGPISLFENPREITPGRVGRFLDQAKSDEAVKGVVLAIESPGGSAVASDMIFEEIGKFRQETNKPVVVQMGDLVASGGYFISAAADRIVANKATLTGSIGVIAKLYNLADLYGKIGVKAETYKKGEFKDMFSEARDRTPEEKAMLEGILDDAYQLFLDRVAQGRSQATKTEWTVEKVKSLAEGKIYSGARAAEVGLIDQVGNLSDAVEQAKVLAGISEAQVVEYSRGSFFEQLFSGISLGILTRLGTPFLDPTPRVMYLLEM